MEARRRSRTGRDDEAGFTLVELLVVLAVIGLLIVAAPAIISAARPGAEAKAVTSEIANDLRMARTRAISGNAEITAIFDIDDNSYAALPGGKARKLPRTLHMTFFGTPHRLNATSSQIRFFPDGSSSGGELQILSAKAKHRIVAYPLTGRIAVDE